MLSPEPRLEDLVAQLGRLPAGDRDAILALLPDGDRQRVRVGLRGRPAQPARPASAYSPDIDALIAAGDEAPITGDARASLARAHAAAGKPGSPSESLADAFGGLLRGRGKR